MTDPRARGAAEEVARAVVRAETIEEATNHVAAAVAQAEEDFLELPLVAGCIKAVADLTRLGYGTSYETVVPAVAQAVKERDDEIQAMANAQLVLNQEIEQQAEEIGRLTDILELFAAERTAGERLRAAAHALVNKMDAVHRDARYISVWTVNQLHAGPYTGPKYNEEMVTLAAALRAPGRTP